MNKETVTSLIENGIYFLDHAKDNIEKDLKLALVTFWTGVEILLKVPIANEHWNLLITSKKRNEININAFKKGAFNSITFDETVKILGNILNNPIPKDSLIHLDKVKKHRNKIIHFHNDEIINSQEETKKELANAWFALHSFIINWKFLFKTDGVYNPLNRLDYFLLNNNKYYIEAKFNSVRNYLDEIIKEGTEVQQCSYCNKKSLVFNFNNDIQNIYNGSCSVCNKTTVSFKFNCLSCNSENYFSNYSDSVSCKSCGYLNDKEEYFNTLYELDNYNHFVYTGCCECMTEDSVIELNSKYICKNCLQIFDEVNTCDCCQYRSTYVQHDSYYLGCEFCNGREYDEDD
ncbi:hypothetical protein [Providencia sp. 2024EL-00732]|uniref:hypothetical protein n=1 Tax=Providencia sp. 2024EL-00732 TaxID=3374242 RepID=UPI0037575770